MRQAILICVVVLAVFTVWAEQPNISNVESAPQNAANPQQGSSAVEAQPQSAQQADSGAVQNQSGQDKKPGAMTRLKRHLRNQVSSGCVQPIGTCWDKPPQDESSQEQPQQTADAQKGRPPRSDSSSSSGESSSRSTKIDLSPPPGEAPAPGVGTDGEVGDVQEMKPWDPHKADKNVEVGDFYFKRGNYRAAVSRYQEALYWKDNDAIAMFRLGQAQEKLGEFADARKSYAGYLNILPDGEFGADARAALDRLKDRVDQSQKAEAKQ